MAAYSIVLPDTPDSGEPSRRERSDALADQITELSGYLYAGTYRLLEMIREFDQEGLWHLDGTNSCAHWLNWKCGTGMNAAREKVRVANALADLPKISEALKRGEISYSKARAMTRIATPDNEDYLMMIARHGTAYHVETLVRKYRRTRKLQEIQDSESQHDRRSLQVYGDDDGSLNVHVRLPQEKAHLLLKAIECAVNQFDDDAAIDTDDVSAETPDEKDSLNKRQADALFAIAESYLANGHARSSSADRYQVMLHVSAETLADEEGGISHLENGRRVSAETSRRICCDAGISVLATDIDGKTVNIGRKSRVIPPGMRRALRSRDENCRFPGCNHKYFIDGHHIRHWSDGGETSLDNLVQLCRHHHRMVHEGGFSCGKDANGDVEFRDPRGVLIPSNGRLPLLPFNFDLTGAMMARCEDRHIDAQTCVTKCDDNRIDWDLAVAHLYA